MTVNVNWGVTVRQVGMVVHFRYEDDIVAGVLQEFKSRCGRCGAHATSYVSWKVPTQVHWQYTCDECGPVVFDLYALAELAGAP